jgi:tetratricopeptide (TPR) repeat protein
MTVLKLETRIRARAIDARVRAASACVAFALFGASGVVRAQVPEAEMRFNQGVRLLKEGRPELAIPEIQEALRKDAKNAFFLKALGVGYSQLADRCPPADVPCRDANLKKAIDAAQRALTENPDYVDARNDLGIALLRIGKRVEGRAELAKAINDPQCPTPEVTAYNLGQAFLEEKNYDEASLWFRAAIQKNKSFPAAYAGMVDVLMAVGQVENALAQVAIGIKETGGNASLQLAQGDALFKAGRFGEAKAAFEAVVRKDPAGAAGRSAAGRLQNFPR